MKSGESRRARRLAFAATLLACACGSRGQSAQPSDGGARDATAEGGPAPTITGLTIAPNPNSVLSARITFTTSVPALDRAVVTNQSDGGADNSFPIAPSTSPSTTHSIAVLGLRASSEFDIAVTATAGGASASASVHFTTPALPPFLPPVTVVTNDPERTSPGFTLLTLWTWTGAPVAKIDKEHSFVVALDAGGQIVWYYAVSGGWPWDAKKLPGGDVLFLDEYYTATEIDPMGDVVRTYTASALGLDSFEHEVRPESSGSTLFLSTELREISGYPVGDAGKTTSYAVVGDRITEVGPDGGVQAHWSSFDMLDPHYFVPGWSYSPLYNFLYYADAGATKDWTHGNAVFVDPSDGRIVASARDLSWIYKFDRNGGGLPRLLWRLGPGGDFRLVAADGGATDDTLQYEQHGVIVLPDGHVMCFDNGDSRPLVGGGPPPGGPFSRALEFALDTTAMTATIAWQYQETPSFYSPSLGSSYVLDNGDVLVCDGGELTTRGGSSGDPHNLKFARIMEVTHTATPQKIAEFDFAQPLGWTDPTFSGFSVYRAVRIASLY